MLRVRRFRLIRSRRGNALVVTAVCLIPIIGAMAVVFDGGLLMAERRNARAVADSAALAAAYSLYNNWSTNKGLDPSGAAKSAALAIAAANGYANDGTTSTVTVNIPPATGAFAGTSGYVEINVQYNQSRAFSALWSSGPMSVAGRTVARGRVIGGNAMPAILLLGTSGTTLSAVGNASVDVNVASGYTGTGGGVYIDSQGSSAVSLKGNADVVAPSVSIAQPGSAPSGITATSGSVTMGAVQTPDPLSLLSTPSTANPPSGISVVSLPSGITSSMTLNSNTVYIVGGRGISLSGTDTLTGSNVMLYITGSNASVNLSGQGAVTLSPMTSGPYQGIVLYQSRSNTNGLTMVGNGNLNVTGTIYAPNALVTAKGNGTTDIFGSQIIANSMSLNGNGAVNVDYDSSVLPAIRDTRIVQ